MERRRCSPTIFTSGLAPPIWRLLGGHGAQPQNGKDPVVMAGEFIVQVQTIVSRQENPRDHAVVTIGDIHGGTKRNVIPYEVESELTTRAFSDQAMQIILDGIRRAAQGVALSAGVPEDRQPIATIVDNESGPATFNDPALTARAKAALVNALGAQNVFDEEPIVASEDFGLFGLEGHRIPTVIPHYRVFLAPQTRPRRGGRSRTAFDASHGAWANAHPHTIAVDST